MRTPKGTMTIEFRSYRLTLYFYNMNYVDGLYGHPRMAAEPMSWESSNADDPTKPIRGCTGYIRFIVDGETMTRENFSKVFSPKDPRDIRFLLESDGASSTTYIQGYLKTEMSDQPWEPYPYEVEIPFVDALMAGDEVRPLNFVERCNSVGNVITMRNLLEWWIEDMEVKTDKMQIYVLGDTDPNRDYLGMEKMQAANCMEVEGNVNGTALYEVKGKTYNDIFSMFLLHTHIYLKGKNINISSWAAPSTSAETLRWHMWNVSGGKIVDTGTIYSATPRELEDRYPMAGANHSSVRLAGRNFYTTTVNFRHESVNLNVDFEKSLQIQKVSTADGTVWGQGNLISYDKSLGLSQEKHCKTDKNSMKVSVLTDEIIKITNPPANTRIFTIETEVPVLANRVDRLLLTGRIVKYHNDGKSPGNRDMWSYINDYAQKLSFLIEWGDLYGNGYGWSNTEIPGEIRMMKNYQNGDTSAFWDAKTDPKNGASSVITEIQYCEDRKIGNYEGIHIASPQSTPANRVCGKIRLHIYTTDEVPGDGDILIAGLNLQAVVNNKEFEYITGDNITGEEVKITAIERGQHPVGKFQYEYIPVTLYKFDSVRSAFSTVSGESLLHFNGEYRQLIGFGYNTVNGYGTITI